MNKLLILSLFVVLCFSLRDDPKYWSKGYSSSEFKLQTDNAQNWFTQIVDHFNYQTTQTYQQRYWVYENYFNPNVGPVFVYICGEYVCQGVP